MDNAETCVICKHLEGWENHSSNNSTTTVLAKGIANIVKVSRTIREDGLHNIIEGRDSMVVHERCRHRYIRSGNPSEPKPKKSRVGNNSDDIQPVEDQAIFNLSKRCVICANKIGRSAPSSNCTTEGTKQKIIDYLQEKSSLELPVRDQILDKLSSLNASNKKGEAIKYHKACYPNLRTPYNYKGDHIYDKIKESMQEIFNYIDANRELEFHTHDFRKVLQEKDMLIPTEKTIWTHVKNYYQQDFIYSSKRGLGRYCCSNDQDFNVLQQSNNQRKDNENTDFDLLDKVAKILVEDIRGYQSNWVSYPASDCMLEKAKIIPEKLKLFLQKLFLNQYGKTFENHESEIISIAHAIMCALLNNMPVDEQENEQN